jgi:exopolysaccharide biosynthesis protein
MRRFPGSLAAMAAIAAAAGVACARPAIAPPQPTALPFSLDSVRSQPLGEGAQHRFLYSRTGPWAIHVLDVRLDRCLAPVAVKGGRSAIGRTTTSDLMRGLHATREVVGGVNADFFLFTPPGVPTGAHVSGGRVLTPPSRQPVFAVDSVGRPHIAVLWSVRPDSFAVDDLRLSTLRLLPFHPTEAVGGRPMLVTDSAFGPTVDTEGAPGFANGRHPRTAVGIADGGRRLVLVVVDGRQAPYSDGMTLRELATLMLALGAPEALNLDGGGSTAMVIADPAQGGAIRVVNRPSDATGERAVGNALGIVRYCAPGD